MNRVISINGHTAVADADGAYRVVVAHRDPGVPNWLDTIGHQKGFLWGRMDRTNDYQPKTTKLKLAELRAQLPAATRTVSADERDAQIRKRRLGAQLRRRW